LSGAPAHAATAGIGGEIRSAPDDFLVEELPLYPFVGEGEHRLLLIEKRNLTTSDVLGRLSRVFQIRRRDIGFAGLKDRRAVTRQWFSLPAGPTSGVSIEDFHQPGSTILREVRHTTKLKRGHLRGNRFHIRVRHAIAGSDVASQMLDDLARRGVPNYFGIQRFGARRNNHRAGVALVQSDGARLLDELLGLRNAEGLADEPARRLFRDGDLDGALRAFPPGSRVECLALRALLDGATPDRLFGVFDRTQRSFWISALQSAVFNAVLTQRREDGTDIALLPGDVAILHNDSGGGSVFDVDADTADVENASSRLRDFQISPTGPMWGPGMKRAAGEVDRTEVGALESIGLSTESIDAFCEKAGKSLMPGQRRPMRVRLTDWEAVDGEDDAGQYIECRFALPRGSFATVVMDAVMTGHAIAPDLD
jgi:tRNA pseudouridine13 synthase